MFKKETVIIGAGLGGLVCGALLSKEGHKVTIVEKNHKVGGGLQSYKRFGVTFDTCMHVFGGMQMNGNIRKICDYLGITERFVSVDLDRDFDTEVYIHSQNEYYSFSLLQDRFVDSLAKYFPGSRNELIAYQHSLRNIMDDFDLFNLRMRISDKTTENEDIFLPADAFIERFISEPTLKTLLSTLNVLYGGEQGITSSLLHAAISVIFMNGACRVAGGYSTFATALASCIFENGGEIITDDEIRGIVSSENGVNWIVTKSGKHIKGDNYISSLPLSTIMTMFDGNIPLSKTYRNWLNMREPSLSAFIINIKLKPNSLKYFNRIGFYLENTSDAWRASDGTDVHRFMYMTPPIIQQGEYAETLNVIIPMQWKAVHQWADTNVGQRGKDYLIFKERILNVALEKLTYIFPDLKNQIDDIDTSSPLTIRDYTGTIKGAICGYRKDCSDTLLFLPVTTRIPNLFITGQCVNLHGFCGVTLTAIETCEAIVGKNTIIRKINKS